VADVAPAATTTVAGTVAAAVLLLESVTVLCAAVPEAAPFKVIVAVEFPDPPITLVGFRTRAVANNGVTVNVAFADPFSVAVITGKAAEDTTLDVTVNVAVVAPSATATLAGTVAAAVLLLASVTVLCAVEPTAGAFKVTVPVEFPDPPKTLVGFNITDATPACGVTVRTALWVPPLNVAEIFAVVVDPTIRLVTVKLAEVAPDATTTLAGIVAAAVLPLASVTVLCAAVPTAGASSVTVPVELVEPPVTLAGLRLTDEINTGFTVSVAFADPFSVAVITGLATADTTFDVTVNVAVVAPAATTTLAGTVAAAVLLLASVTVLCAVVPSAEAFNVTVAVEFAEPPSTLVGFKVKDSTPACGVMVRTAL